MFLIIIRERPFRIVTFSKNNVRQVDYQELTGIAAVQRRVAVMTSRPELKNKYSTFLFES